MYQKGKTYIIQVIHVLCISKTVQLGVGRMNSSSMHLLNSRNKAGRLIMPTELKARLLLPPPAEISPFLTDN